MIEPIQARVTVDDWWALLEIYPRLVIQTRPEHPEHYLNRACINRVISLDEQLSFELMLRAGSVWWP